MNPLRILPIILLLTSAHAAAAPVEFVPGSAVRLENFYALGLHLKSTLNNSGQAFAASSCPTQSVAWSNPGGNIMCSSFAGQSPHNAVIFVTSNAGPTGQARFRCNGHTRSFEFDDQSIFSCN